MNISKLIASLLFVGSLLCLEGFSVPENFQHTPSKPQKIQTVKKAQTVQKTEKVETVKKAENAKKDVGPNQAEETPLNLP